jgi:rubrerythrin
MRNWTLEDIPWDKFDGTRVDPEILAVVKTASLVEHNSADYAIYLSNVFPDDPEFQAEANAWALEEVQHGAALGRWAEMADPGFDFQSSFRRFAEGYRIPVDAEASVRGSHSGELIARCVVETGTSSLYSALRDATDEPVLKAVCHRIAGDEFRHYKLFYTNLQRYLAREKPGLLRRALVVFRRFYEIDDDELSYAYHCANLADKTYDRQRAANAYLGRVGACYRRDHVQRAVAMAMKAIGVSPQGRLGRLATGIVWLRFRRQVRQLQAS